VNVDWDDLLPYLHRAARAIFDGVGIEGDYEDAAQEACCIIFMIKDVQHPKALGQMILKRLRRRILISHAYTKRGNMCDVSVRAGFDAGLLAGDWIENALPLMPLKYRDLITDMDIVHREYGAEKTPKQKKAVAQRYWRAKFTMRAALTEVG